MKRKLILAAASLMLSFAPSAFAQHRADRQNLTDENSFSMILLGDPQGYVKYDINQPIFELCTAWIADNVDHLNIKRFFAQETLLSRTTTMLSTAICSTRQAPRCGSQSQEASSALTILFLTC
jgi:hypothetical protein